MEPQEMLDQLCRIEGVGWRVRFKNPPEIQLSESISRRHQIPDEYLSFLSIVESCVSGDEKSWLLCEADYQGTSESAFRWDEFEQISLEAADDDPDFKGEVEAFWDSCLPILMSVVDRYRYFGILTRGNLIGKIVEGSEPEFEETEVVAESFLDFLTKLTAGVIVL